MSYEVPIALARQPWRVILRFPVVGRPAKPSKGELAGHAQVQMWRETDFLVTDLYPADVADGKHVLLIYTGDTLDKYLAIKADKAALREAGEYHGEARDEIARRFGRLLSYPEPVIDDLLAREKLLED